MKYLNDWTYTVCITLIFSIIFSLLLPKNSNGKVGKIIITVFIMLSLIAPFKANGFDLSFEDLKVINEQQTENKEKSYSTTIKSNIEFGEEIDEAALNSAIDIAQAREIISEKELGIDEPITQGGTNVSGGQKQRISIARALAKRDANIFIFDDSFSALDYKTDKKLRDELSKMIEKKKSTVLIVAQRISTIKNADKIVVLDEGKIVGMGKHSELMKDCDVYKEIAYSQLSKEELEDACA